VIQPLVTFIDTNEQDDDLLDVPARLKQVEGFLAVLSHNKAAKLLAQCNKYIEKVFIKESTVPAEEKLKALADVLIAIELYLDTLAGNPMDADDILNVAERQLSLITGN
jgi:chemosensory pili system protein ChpA (sensor histidine kinase/response regulator)